MGLGAVSHRLAEPVRSESHAKGEVGSVETRTKCRADRSPQFRLQIRSVRESVQFAEHASGRCPESGVNSLGFVCVNCSDAISRSRTS